VASDTIILFGAGATKACGGPLTNEILPQAFEPTVCTEIEREYYIDLLDRFLLRELVHVSRLDVGATMAAIAVGLRFRDCYYLILSSYVDGELARFGPGRAHLHELIRYAMARGFARFDFTVGDEPYKRDWSDIELKLYDYLAAVTLRGLLVAAMTRAFRRTKRFIKQSPVLWPAFSRARALAGSISSQ
jgi:CelD/BcsL family acetyltransferase involved in cellulose biosynthesis